MRIAVLAGLVTVLVSGPLTATATVAAPIEIRTAVVVLDYNDGTYGLTPTRRIGLANLHFGTQGYDTLTRYFEEASDGRFTFAPLPGRDPVLGPFAVDANRTCDLFAIRGHAVAALTANGIPKSEYDAISVHHRRKYGCNWGAAGWNQDGIKTTVYGETAGAFVLKHEFGHTFGLPHMPSVKCTETLADCVYSGYRGSSPMGAQNTGLSAPEIRKKYWLKASQLVLAHVPGTYTLAPLHAPRDVAGTRILEIPRDNEWNRLFVAYRAKATIDTGTAGVQLHRSKANGQIPYHSFALIDPSPETGGHKDTNLAVGTSITDPVTGLTITTVSEDETGAVVRIAGTS